MKLVSRVLRITSVAGENRILLIAWCPGCDQQHPWWVQDPDKAPSDPGHLWTWDGNAERPTIGPSLLVHPHAGDPPQPLCHSFMVAGQWQFLADCDHQLAGQTVDMVPLPDWVSI